MFLGEISYSIYILQKPIFYCAKWIMKYLNINNGTIVFYSALFILIIISGVSFKYFETPLRRKINRKRRAMKHN